MALTISGITYDSTVQGVWVCDAVNSGSAAAATVRCGFQPRYIMVMNVTDGIRDEYIGFTAGTSVETAANGTVTIAAASGFTLDDGTGTVTTATGSATTGAGFSMSTGILIASKTYRIYAYH